MGHLAPRFEIFGLVFDISVMYMSALAAGLVLLIVILATRNMTEGVPSGMQNFFEWVLEFVKNIGTQFMDEKTAQRFVGLALTLILFILISNQLGLIFQFWTEHTEPVPAVGIDEEVFAENAVETAHGPAVSIVWWKSPTATPSVTFALAITVLLYSHYLGLKRSPGGYFKHYIQPNPLLLPMNLIEEITKLLTLPLRLFGNIFAGEVLIAFLVAGGLMAKMFSTLPFIVWLGYSLFVGTIQAYIFTTLTLVYISQKVSPEGH